MILNSWLSCLPFCCRLQANATHHAWCIWHRSTLTYCLMNARQALCQLSCIPSPCFGFLKVSLGWMWCCRYAVPLTLELRQEALLSSRIREQHGECKWVSEKCKNSLSFHNSPCKKKKKRVLILRWLDFGSTYTSHKLSTSHVAYANKDSVFGSWMKPGVVTHLGNSSPGKAEARGLPWVPSQWDYV